MGKDDVDVYTRMKQMVDQQMRGLHTASPAIVEEVDIDEQRVTVTLKEDEEVFIGDVPIASTFARHGEGIVYPVAKDDEGLLLHTRESLHNKQDERGHKETEVKRHHTLESAVFFPMFWFDEDEKPDYEEGQLRIQLNNALPTEDPEEAIDVRLDPYEGEVEVIVMDDDGQPAASLFLSGDGGTELVSLDAGEPMSQIVVENDGSVRVTNIDEGKTWEMTGSGLVKIDDAEVVTEDGEMNDTFLGIFGGDVVSSGQG